MKKKKEQTIVIANNIKGKVLEIDDKSIQIQANNEILKFDISKLDLKGILINDEVSIIYNGEISNLDTKDVKVVSIVLEKRETFKTNLIEVTGKVSTGTNYKTIVISDGSNVLKLLNENVVIEFEGDLVPGMNIKVTYLETQGEEYDGILQSLTILES